MATSDNEPEPCTPALKATTNSTDAHPNVTPTPTFLLNVRGLLQLSNRSKISYLRDLATCSQALCMALTETHLTPNIGDAEIHIPKYVVFRTDRKDRSHGGVAMYIREDVTPVVLLSYLMGMLGNSMMSSLAYMEAMDMV